MTMKRREFLNLMPLGSILSHAAFSSATPTLGSHAPSWASEAMPGQERAGEALQGAMVIDALISTSEWTEESFDMARGAGLTALGTSLSTGSWDAAMRELEAWNERIREEPDRYLRADSAADFREAQATGRLGVLLGFQNTTMIGRSLDRLDQLYAAGTRWIQLTYNARNLVGDGCTERTNAGLSDFGVEVVQRMNELGILVDLSHCGYQTTMDAILFSDPGPCFTHTMCEALYPRHPRAKTDKQIRAMATGGGVMGVVALGYMVGPDPGGETTLGTYVDHIDHAVQVAGIEHVGVASDFAMEGIAPTATRESWYEPRLRSFKPSYQVRWPPWIPELDSPSRYCSVAQALDRRGYTTGEIEKIMGLNWLRYYDEAL